MKHLEWSDMDEPQRLNALHYALGAFSAHMSPDDLRTRAKQERKAGWFYSSEFAALLDWMADSREAIEAAKAAS